MYVQHPYKYEGKYYAKIDGVFYEISKEVAMAMFAEYRNEIYRSRKWAPESEEDDQMEDFQDKQHFYNFLFPCLNFLRVFCI